MKRREILTNGCDDSHTLFILALKLVCEALITFQAAVSMSLVAFFSAGDEK